jgi:methionine-rich copper-binding protein CopC
MRIKIRNVAILSLIFATLFTPSAWAHSAVVSQNPAPSSEIQELPVSLEITFNEKLLDLGSGNQIQMLDPNGDEVTTGDLTISNETLSRKLTPSSVLGEYYVSYRAVSTDGHVIAGEYTFSLLASDAAIKNAPTAPPLGEQNEETNEDENNESSTGLIAAGILAALLASSFVFWRFKARK